MLTIRSFFLDGVALLGVGVGLVAGVGGYLSDVPDPIERTAMASAWAGPETTGSVAPKDEVTPRSGGTSAGTGRAHRTEIDAADPEHRGRRRNPTRARRPAMPSMYGVQADAARRPASRRGA